MRLAVAFTLLPAAVLAAEKAKPPMSAKDILEKNPVAAPWSGPYGGVPPWDKVTVADVGPALETAMADGLKDIDRVASNKAPPTFENTIVAFERAAQPLTRALSIFGVFSSNLSTDEFRPVEEAMTPKLAAYQDSVYQNEKLFARVKAVYQSDAKAKLTPEQQRLTWLTFTNFELQGANLNAEQKKQLSQYNQRLAELSTKFAQNLLADEAKAALVIEQKSDLAGLPEAQIAAAAAEAENRKMKGKWVFANTRSAVEPFLTYASNRALREKAFRAWVKRGDNGDENDNNKIITEILGVRAKKAKLLGYPTFAHWRLVNTMAKDPNAAMNLMMSVWKPAADAFRKDVAEAQAIADKEGAKFKIEPWDYRYYIEKLRLAKYDLDLNAVRPYLQLEHIREAMFASAQALYGFTFTKVDKVPVFHPDMTVYEVKGAKGEHVGLWYFDPYARTGKKSGAWMTAYRDQQKDQHKTTLVSNNSNFIKGAPGQPTTIGWDDAQTMFHEFGHALHGLNANATYASLSGTNTARDFVEFPSQFNENYLLTPLVLKFLVNEKGERIPDSLLERIAKAKSFNEGFATGEAQASALVDMKFHLAGETPIDPKAFEKQALAEIGMPAEMVMRHRPTGFAHIFSDEGYAAGYYSYIWSEVLDADAFAAFTEAGDPYDKATAKRLHDTVMSVGNTVDPSVAFKNFRGRDPSPVPLLKRKGFPGAGVDATVGDCSTTPTAGRRRFFQENRARPLRDLVVPTTTLKCVSAHTPSSSSVRPGVDCPASRPSALRQFQTRDSVDAFVGQAISRQKSDSSRGARCRHSSASSVSPFFEYSLSGVSCSEHRAPAQSLEVCRHELNAADRQRGQALLGSAAASRVTPSRTRALEYTSSDVSFEKKGSPTTPMLPASS